MEKELKNMSNWVKFILVNFPKWEAGEPTRCASRDYPSLKALPPSLNLNQFSYLEPVRADNLIKAFAERRPVVRFYLGQFFFHHFKILIL